MIEEPHRGGGLGPLGGCRVTNKKEQNKRNRRSSCLSLIGTNFRDRRQTERCPNTNYRCGLGYFD